MSTVSSRSVDPVSQLPLLVCVPSVALGKVPVVSSEVKVMGMLQKLFLLLGLVAIAVIAVVLVLLIDVVGVQVVALPLAACFAY